MKKQTTKPIESIRVTLGNPGEFPVQLSKEQADEFTVAKYRHDREMESIRRAESKFLRVIGFIAIIGVLGLCAWDVWNRRKQGLQLVTLTK